MDQINCNVINDILPLYIDDVVSEDTRAVVDGHLKECEYCSKKLSGMRRDIEMDIQMKAYEAEKKAMQDAKRKMKRKRIMTILLSVIAGVVIISIIVSAMNLITIPVRFDKNHIEIGVRSVEGQDCLYCKYTGVMYASQIIEVNEDGKHIYYMQIVTTPWHNLFGGDDENTESDLFLISLNSSEELIDELRYIKDGKMTQYYDPAHVDQNQLKEHSELLWENPANEDQQH